MDNPQETKAGRRPLLIFFLIAYAWSWSVFLAMAMFHLPLPWTIVGTLGPSVAALAAQRLTSGNFRAFRLAAGLAPTLWGAVGGVAVILFAYAALPALLTIPVGKIQWTAFLTVSVFTVSTLLAGPLFEEPGWRGFALPRLQARFGPLPAALLLGLLWAGWHLPLFLIPGWSSSPVWIYFLIVTGLSVIMSWGANLARFGVAVPVLMHAAFNTAPRYLPGLLAEETPQTSLPFELVMALAGLGTALVLTGLTRGRLGAGPPGQR